MSDTPNLVHISEGEDVPEDLPENTLVFADGVVVAGIGVYPLDDGCLGQHWPNSPTCEEHVR